MPLTNQPYLPLFVKDWLTSKKLKFCEINSHGLMINIMCYMHKEDDYGIILLEEKYKQNGSTVTNFALQFTKLLPFDKETIIKSLTELLQQKVLYLEDDRLICKRMVKDAKLSEIRALSGSKGGLKNKNNSKKFAKAKSQANSENENENENAINNVFKKGKKFKIPTPEEVNEYAAKINYKIDGQYFCDWYQSKDWMIGKNKMKDWKAAIRTWKKKGQNEKDIGSKPESFRKGSGNRGFNIETSS